HESVSVNPFFNLTFVNRLVKLSGQKIVPAANFYPNCETGKPINEIQKQIKDFFSLTEKIKIENAIIKTKNRKHDLMNKKQKKNDELITTAQLAQIKELLESMVKE